MAARFENTPENWLKFFNPSVFAITGQYIKSCSPWCTDDSVPDEEKPFCAYESAHREAKKIIKGTAESNEWNLLRDSLMHYIGKEYVTLDAKLERLEESAVDGLATQISALGSTLADAALYFPHYAKTITEQASTSFTGSQNAAYFMINETHRKIALMKKDEDVQPLLEEMQSALKTAIDLGLHEYGAVIRYSIAFGVGHYLMEKTTDTLALKYLEAIVR
jgi:hypothetical protein